MHGTLRFYLDRKAKFDTKTLLLNMYLDYLSFELPHELPYECAHGVELFNESCSYWASPSSLENTHLLALGDQWMSLFAELMC